MIGGVIRKLLVVVFGCSAALLLASCHEPFASLSDKAFSGTASGTYDGWIYDDNLAQNKNDYGDGKDSLTPGQFDPTNIAITDAHDPSKKYAFDNGYIFRGKGSTNIVLLIAGIKANESNCDNGKNCNVKKHVCTGSRAAQLAQQGGGLVPDADFVHPMAGTIEGSWVVDSALIWKTKADGKPVFGGVPQRITVTETKPGNDNKQVTIKVSGWGLVQPGANNSSNLVLFLRDQPDQEPESKGLPYIDFEALNCTVHAVFGGPPIEYATPLP